MKDVSGYFDYTQQPWGQLFYRVVREQLNFARGLRILDFGSGFGITADYLAARNDVTAVEPDQRMIDRSSRKNNYAQIRGGLEDLAAMPGNSYDLILCHNVLEYAEAIEPIARQFARLLSPGGQLSLIKHNPAGKVMAKAVFGDDADGAMALLDGETPESQHCGEIRDYDIRLIESCGFRVTESMGVRIFFGLGQDNDQKFDRNWQDSMLALELKASRLEAFRAIAFFNHIIMNGDKPYGLR